MQVGNAWTRVYLSGIWGALVRVMHYGLSGAIPL